MTQDTKAPAQMWTMTMPISAIPRHRLECMFEEEAIKRAATEARAEAAEAERDKLAKALRAAIDDIGEYERMRGPLLRR